MNNSEFQAYTENVERSLQHVNALTDETARRTALELMQGLMDLHGAALSRIVELLSAGDSGTHALTKLADDPLVCGLLVLYGVHPLSLQDRVLRAMERLQPQLQKVGANLELTSTDDNLVRISLHNSHSDTHSAAALRTTIEQAIREAAPEVVEIAIEGMLPSGFVPLTMIQPAMKYEPGEAI